MFKFKDLTDRQNEILSTILVYMARRNNKPTLRSLCKILGIRSPNGVMNHIRRLAKKGYLQFNDTKTHDIFDLGERVPKSMVKEMQGAVCLFNVKWRLTGDEARRLAKELIKMADKVNDGPPAADFADTDDRSLAHEEREAAAPLA